MSGSNQQEITVNRDQFLLYEVIKAFSSALDLINKHVVGHHRKVSYIAAMLAQEMNLSEKDTAKLLYAGLIHDMGVFYLDESYDDLSFDTQDNLHALTGYHLLKDNFPLREVALIIESHHLNWQEMDHQQDEMRLSSILFLSDRLSTLIKNDQAAVLDTVSSMLDKIKQLSGKRFWPEAVEALEKLAQMEYFWLNLISPRYVEDQLDLYSILGRQLIGIDDLLGLSDIFSHIIDYRSPFTATHSLAIGNVAERLATYFDFAPDELKLMRIAGYLHDIGKLIIPLEILEKPGKLNSREWNTMKTHTFYTYQILYQVQGLEAVAEWAAYHHETLRGDGYPFHLDRDGLSTGSRIMAVADVFTAVTEDRPYRKGMDQESVISLLDRLVRENKLDGSVTGIITDNYQEFNQLREECQEHYRHYYDQFRSKIERLKERERKGDDRPAASTDI